MPKKPKPSDFALLESLWREPVERSVLPNGLTLVVKPDRAAALASVQVWVKTGSIHEGGHLGAGLSHFLEHMLFKGTARRAGREIAATVQAHGGYINAYTTFDRTVYYIDLPSEHAEVALDVLADAVLHSTLPAEEVAREKEVILREISMTQDDPDHRLWESAFATAFREHPYRQPVIGHRELFSRVTRDDLAGYYAGRYGPDNLAVIVVGDVEPPSIRAAVERHFGAAARAGVAPVYVPPEPSQLGPRQNHRFEDVELARGVLAWPVPGLAHPDAPVLDLLAMVLGYGDSSLLWREIREKSGLVHTIQASTWNPGSAGLFCVDFNSDASKRAAAAAAIERALASWSDRELPSGQLRKAQRQLVMAEIHARKTMSGQASRLGAAEVVVGDLAYTRAYFERLQAVAASDLRRVLRTYVVPWRLTSVSINPASVPSNGTSAGSPPPRPAKAGRRPAFSLTALPNGARLAIGRDARLPNLHLRLLLGGGPVFERPGKRGSTALLATLLTKDTRRRTAAQVAQRIEEVGGSFYPFSGNNSLGLAAEVLPTDAGRALDLLGEAFLSPAFRLATFRRERDAQLAELQQDADDVVAFSRKLLRRKFFGSHPLALDAEGDEAGVKVLAPADLADLHRRLRPAGNVVLAVAGDVPDSLVPRLEAFLERIPPGSAPAGSGAVRPEASGDFVETRPREQAVVLQGFPAPPLLAGDFPVGEVADELFSGMASRLFERVRETKGLAYFVRSERVTGLDAAMFSFLAGTKPGREKEVAEEIEAEIRRVQSGEIEEAELRRCRERLKAARRQGMQSNAARALRVGLDVLQGRPVDDFERYDARIEAVTAADLAAFARRYLAPERRVRLVVRP